MEKQHNVFAYHAPSANHVTYLVALLGAPQLGIAGPLQPPFILRISAYQYLVNTELDTAVCLTVCLQLKSVRLVSLLASWHFALAYWDAALRKGAPCHHRFFSHVLLIQHPPLSNILRVERYVSVNSTSQFTVNYFS